MSGRLLRETTRIKLEAQSLDDESFLYIAAHGHSGEFIRLLQLNAGANIISPKAKNEALSLIVNKGHPKEMVYELLKNGRVNASRTISFIGTLLHWACVHGYIEIVGLLLKYPDVDPCAKTSGDRQPIHLAVSQGHTKSNLMLNFSF
jgi:ankyrin repeat protein